MNWDLQNAGSDKCCTGTFALMEILELLPLVKRRGSPRALKETRWVTVFLKEEKDQTEFKN